MEKSQRRTGDGRGPAEGRGFLGRLHDLLEESLAGRRLVPVPIPAGAEGAYRPRLTPPAEMSFHRVFGRRKDEEREREEAAADQGSDEQPTPEADAAADAADDLGGTGSDQAASDLSDADGTDLTDSSGESPAESVAAKDENAVAADPDPWSGQAMTDPFTFPPNAEATELPAWTPSPLSGTGFPSFETTPATESSETSPWSGGFGVEEEAPAPAEFSGVSSEAQAWPPSSAEGGGQLWSAARDEQDEGGSSALGAEEEPTQPVAAPDYPGQADEGGYQPPELVETREEGVGMEASDETVQGEPGDLQPFEPDQLPEVVAVSETAWAVSSTGAGYQAVDEPEIPEAVVVDSARTFPLPEGELLFRNLSVGFTDPARLLRHLAGEGHTGVMHVASPDGRNTYIVLVDGYVVAVASDSQGRLSTSSRVSFPAFPNSQDIITVVSYSAEIARGLGLLLHAPVHFSGLGAMFVDLDGLRSFLTKRSASGGLVVESATGTGVALFDEGRLVGAYSGASVPEEDLAPLRELIKDLDAEIDVRFGGPHSLEPIPLETLLAGYSL